MKILLGLLPILISNSVSAQDAGWPAAVSNAGMTWDSATGQTLFYGGMRDRGVHADSTLWVWNGTRWSVLGDGAPGARSGLLLVSDPHRGRVLLYGGQTRSAQYDDTWTWQAGRWTRVSTTGPGTRHMAAGTFDIARDQLVVFGGYSIERQAMLGDTWVWDSAAWRKVSEDGPPARAGHVLGFDPVLQRVIMMGGSDSQGRPFTDTWSWDGVRWTRIADGPAITPNTQLVALPGNGMGTFGGWDGSRPSGSLFQWNGTTWRVTEDPGGPAPRMETALAFDRTRSRLILFGGSDANGNKLHDLWEFDGRAWIRLPKPH